MPTHQPSTGDVKHAILTEAQRIEEDTLYSSRTQFESGRIWNAWSLVIGIPTTVLAAAAGASAIAEYPALAAFLAISAAIGSALATFLNPSRRASQHHQAGTSFNALRNDTRIFRTIDGQSTDDAISLRTGLKQLNERRNALNSDAPSPPRRAYKRAQKHLEAGEATHAVDGSPS